LQKYDEAEEICEKFIREETPSEFVVAAYSRLSKVREERKLHDQQERALYKKMVSGQAKAQEEKEIVKPEDVLEEKITEILPPKIDEKVVVEEKKARVEME